MKAEISLKQLWFNLTIAQFFMRQQALKELERLVKLVGGDTDEDQFDALSDAVEEAYADLNEFEEDLYEREAEAIAVDLNIEDEPTLSGFPEF